jgi:hypothetical protein
MAASLWPILTLQNACVYDLNYGNRDKTTVFERERPLPIGCVRLDGVFAHMVSGYVN